MDDEEVSWRERSLCRNMPTNFFFDWYEADPVLAEIIDNVCLRCPVRKLCLQEGVENGEQGVRGAVYLTSGRPDKNKNAHKSEEVWDEIKGYIL